MLGALKLRVRMGNYVYRSVFYVAERLAVPVIIGTGFMNVHVETIRCIAQQIVLARGGRLPILSSGNAAKPVQAPEDQQSDDDEVDFEKEPEADSERAPAQRKPLGC